MEDLNMKKTYMTPIVNIESAQPTNIICVSFDSNVGLEDGGGSNGNAHAPESDWDIWADE